MTWVQRQSSVIKNEGSASALEQRLFHGSEVKCVQNEIKFFPTKIQIRNNIVQKNQTVLSLMKM